MRKFLFLTIFFSINTIYPMQYTAGHAPRYKSLKDVQKNASKVAGISAGLGLCCGILTLKSFAGALCCALSCATSCGLMCSWCDMANTPLFVYKDLKKKLQDPDDDGLLEIAKIKNQDEFEQAIRNQFIGSESPFLLGYNFFADRLEVLQHANAAFSKLCHEKELTNDQRNDCVLSIGKNNKEIPDINDALIKIRNHPAFISGLPRLVRRQKNICPSSP